MARRQVKYPPADSTRLPRFFSCNSASRSSDITLTGHSSGSERHFSIAKAFSLAISRPAVSTLQSGAAGPLLLLLFREQQLGIHIGREGDVEETDHHLFPSLVPPLHGLRGV